MVTRPPRKIVDVERLFGGVIITFDDDRCAVYSADLLYALAGAQRVDAPLEEDTPPEQDSE